MPYVSIKNLMTRGPSRFNGKTIKTSRTLDIKLIYYVIMFLVETRTSFIIKGTP